MSKRFLAAIAAATLLVLLAVGGYYGWTQHKKRAAVSMLAPHVTLAAVHVNRFVDWELDPKNVTFMEYFAKASSSVDDMEKAVVAIKTSDASAFPEISETAVTFIERSQAVIRSMSASKRYVLTGSNALERAKERRRDAENASSSYAASLDTRSARLALEEAQDALAKQTSEMHELVKHVEAMREAASALEAATGIHIDMSKAAQWLEEDAPKKP